MSNDKIHTKNLKTTGRGMGVLSVPPRLATVLLSLDINIPYNINVDEPEETNYRCDYTGGRESEGYFENGE